jgi:hypothetical protein
MQTFSAAAAARTGSLRRDPVKATFGLQIFTRSDRGYSWFKNTESLHPLFKDERFLSLWESYDQHAEAADCPQAITKTHIR